MWVSNLEFNDIVRDKMHQNIKICKMLQLLQILKSMKKPLQQLNKDKFLDIHNQQVLFK